MSRIPMIALPAAMSLAACQHSAPEVEESAASAQDAFFAALTTHCGKAYGGQLVSDDAADTDMAGAEMVMHVRECSGTQISVPFHIRQSDAEWDRSRTWIFTRADGGLRLKHDHRHEDGERDAVTMYGGDTAEVGAADVQTFPVDAESIAMFRAEGLDASVTNVWTVSVEPVDAVDAQFTYQLRRTVESGAPEDRLFRVEFDLTHEVAAPPAPWGFETAGS